MNRLIIAVYTLLFPAFVVAENAPIYKIERNGAVEYTSKPDVKGAKVASLPKLGRWELTNPTASGVTCGAHGGINCALGPDTDGSVICLDDFKDSTMRFKFECTAAKLEVLQITDPKADGSFTVIVRNSKSIPATKSTVLFKPERLKDGVVLKGPDQIEGFGVGDFTFRPTTKSVAAAKPKASQLIVSCENCG